MIKTKSLFKRQHILTRPIFHMSRSLKIIYIFTTLWQDNKQTILTEIELQKLILLSFPTGELCNLCIFSRTELQFLIDDCQQELNSIFLI